MISQGFLAAGLEHLQRGLTYAQAVESAVTLAEGHIRLAEGKLAAGDREGAYEAGQAGFAIVAGVKHQFALGLAHRVLGQVATARGEWGAADDHFRKALDLLGGIDAQQEIGRTLFSFAEMWQRWSAAGNGPLPEGATVMLRQAAQIFERLDMRHDLAATRAALGES